MAFQSAAANDSVNKFVNWGVVPSAALWPTTLRILFVIDGRINTTSDPSGFGLGYVLETLRDESFAWWVRFLVTVVRRDQGADVPQFLQGEDTNYNADGSPPINEFKFTPESLANWNQIWFFADNPGNRTDNINDYFPLQDDELVALAEWMDRGGGVFAAGDHWNLGASMCWRIPRVRTMRRWLPAQGVPPMDGPARHQTLQPGATLFPDALEKDTIPQPIEVVQQQLTTSILVRPFFPHSLLARPGGVIETFPDHMHEGDVIVDGAVELDRPLDIQGYNRPEYPYVDPQNNPGIAAGPGDEAGLRPRPHIVAFGRTTNVWTPENAPAAAAIGMTALDTTSPLFSHRFGLIGAYDGDSVGIGRVVVESTWHHWFSYNLQAYAAAYPPTQYQLMQIYYRNVAVWLSTPAQRQSMLVASAWGSVVSDPMAFPLTPPRSLWAVGERAIGVISRTISPSMLFDFVGSFFAGNAGQIFGVPYDADPSAPRVASVPADLTLRAIVGGLASSLIPPAYDYLAKGARPLLDPSAIARQAAEGIQQGYRALVDTIESSAAASKGIVDQLQGAFKPSPQPPIPVDVIRVRVVAERLQFPDPTDPALAEVHPVRGKGGHATFTITARVAIAGSIVTSTVIDKIEVPSFGPGGGFIDLNRVLYEGVVQTGEAMEVEIVTGKAERGLVADERLRFSDTLTGDPSQWIAPHSPARSQPWRLWYRIEKMHQ